MFKKIAMLAVLSSLAFGLTAPAYADSNVVLRVVTVKTDDVATYTHELDKARVILKRLGISATVRVWRATLAGPNTGLVIVSQEYANLGAFADSTTKTAADAEYTQWLKNLDKIRTVVSDSLYREL